MSNREAKRETAKVQAALKRGKNKKMKIRIKIKIREAKRETAKVQAALERGKGKLRAKTKDKKELKRSLQTDVFLSQWRTQVRVP